MEYKCFTCGKLVDREHVRRKVRCPYCSGKILFKVRPPVKKTVKAR